MPKEIILKADEHERLVSILMEGRDGDLPDIDIVREALDEPAEDGSTTILNQPEVIESLKRLLAGRTAASGNGIDTEWTEWRCASLLLYEHSPILQTIAAPGDMPPRELLKRLTALSPEIAREQTASTQTRGSGMARYSTVTLVNALNAGGKLTGDAQMLIRLAAAWHIETASPTLQSIRPTDLDSPTKTIELLEALRAKIARELGIACGKGNKFAHAVPLVKLVYALAAAGLIPLDALEAYVRQAGAKDLYERSPLLRRIDSDEFRDAVTLIRKIHGLRSKVLREQGRKKKGHGSAPKGYASSTLLYAIAAGLGLEASIERHLRLANAYDLFMRSEILRGVEIDALMRPIDLIEKLSHLRSAIIREQQHVKRTNGGKRIETYSLMTLMNALAAGGKISGPVRKFSSLAAARDVYERSPTLGAIPDHVLRHDGHLLLFLLAFRDRVAIENLRARGKFSSEEVTFDGAEKHFALSSLIEALAAGGRIDAKRTARIMRTKAGPLEYFLARRDIAEPPVRQTLHFDGRKKKPGVLHLLDKTRFTWLNDPGRTLGESYIRSIMQMGRWFLKQPGAMSKSVYDAPAVFNAATLPIRNPELGMQSSDEITRRLSLLVFEAEESRRDFADSFLTDREALTLAEAAREHALAPAVSRLKAVTAARRIIAHNRAARGGVHPDIREAYASGIERICDLNEDLSTVSVKATSSLYLTALPMLTPGVMVRSP